MEDTEEKKYVHKSYVPSASCPLTLALPHLITKAIDFISFKLNYNAYMNFVHTETYTYSKSKYLTPIIKYI